MIKAREEVQNLSLRLNANRELRGLRLPYHIDRSQRVRGGHVWPCPLDRRVDQELNQPNK